MIKIKFASLALLTLSFITTVALEEYHSASSSHGPLKISFPDLDLKVSLYSIPSLSELALKFETSSPITWDPENETDLPQATSFCAPAPYYRSLPKGDLYIIIDLVHSPQVSQLSECTNSKFTSYLLKTTESEASTAFLQALTILAQKKNKVSKPIILLDSNFNRKLQNGSPLECGDFYFDDNGLCNPCIVGCSSCSNGQTCDVCFPGDLEYYSYWKNSTNQCNFCAWYECQTCITDETCEKCLPGFKLTADQKCEKCNDKYCKTCSELNVCETCYEGFIVNSDTGACDICEVKGCEQCQTLSTCDKCYDGLFFDGSSCKQCSSNCYKCDDQETCTECSDGFWIDSGKCSKCPQGCDKCGNSVDCEICAIGYLTDDIGRCKACPTFCKECNSQQCLACLPGYFYDDTNSQCVPCSINCEECFNLTSCFYCKEGIIKDGFCANCKDNCDLCDNDQCLRCREGFYLEESFGICLPCKEIGCKACSDAGCLECYDNYYLDEDANTCVDCGKSCNWCEEGVCFWCVEGHYLSDGLCEPCDDKNCLFCEKTGCLECIEGFSLDDDLKCSGCGYGCSVCDDGVCSMCYDNFYFISAEHSCYGCIYGCEKCFDGETCDKCFGGFFLGDGGVCQECPWSCEICADDHSCTSCYEGYYVDYNNECQSCVYGCFKCKSEDTCIQCHSGFFMKEKECISCIPECEICTEEFSCEKCYDRFYLFEGQCVKCPDSCEKCDDNGKCLECQAYFYLNQNDLCIQCHKGCLYCSEFETCDWCDQGFYSYNNFCQPCIENCINCQSYETCDACNKTYYPYSYNNPDGSISMDCKKCPEGCHDCDDTYCYECSLQYYYDSSLEQCSPCMENCKGCNYNDNEEELYCWWCQDGFYISDVNCEPCGENCLECDEYGCYRCLPTFYSDDEGVCNKCIDNCQECWDIYSCNMCDEGFIYDYTRNRCTQCNDNCLVCDKNQICSVCDDYFYLVDGRCEVCGDFCVNCNEKGCFKCDYGLYLADGVCNFCQGNCESCSAENYCEICYEGYYLVIAEDGLSAVCQYCSIKGCSICGDDKCTVCKSSYYLEDDICKSCPNGCVDCVNDLECRWCDYGYYLNPSLTCSKCMAGCTDCYAESTDNGIIQYCYECNVTFYWIEDYTCGRCIDKCDYCGNSETCDQCEPEYFFSNSENACVKCMKNCLECKDSRKCGLCNTGYFWYEKNSYCKACDYGCSECDGNSCTTCLEEFYLDYDKNQCVHCPPNCYACESQDYCYECYEGFTYNEETQKCEECLKYCSECTSTDCYSCYYGYYLEVVAKDDVEQSICSPCPENCYYCEEGACYECNYGYFINNNLKCEECKDNCDICTSTTDCSECSWGYFYEEQSTNCISCPDNCALCNVDGCIYCFYGYYFNIEANECKACSDNCEYCDDDGVCLECQYKYYLNEENSCAPCKSDSCVKCSSESDCKECEAGYFPDDKGNCKNCPNNCDSCDFQSECKECSHNFFKGTKGECLKCPDYCSGCKNYDFCDACAEGFIQNFDGTCSQCSRDCKYCNSIDECVECWEGSYLNNDKKCSRCSNGCSYCESEEICGGCDYGFYLESGFCIPCADPNCYDCSSSICFGCYEGYLLNQANFTCDICLDNCLYCFTGSECEICYDGFFLSTERTECLPCGKNCLTCTDSELCKSCIEGTFMKTEGKCSKCKNNCLECDADKCYVCEDGFFVNQAGSCSKCSKNCAKCIEKGICLGCFEGFYADSTSTCVACQGNCAVCLDDKVCNQCLRGYLLSEDNTCSTCKKNCAVCDDSGVCSECLDGFELDELTNKCFTCSITEIEEAKITQDYKRLKIKMVSIIDNKTPICENVISTVESFGDDWQCKVDGKFFIVNFGNNYIFNDETLFTVYVEHLFTNPCYFEPIYDVTATFEKEPPVPQGKVKGLPFVSLGCGGSDLEYYLDEVKGSGKLPVTVKWTATVDPPNESVTQYVETLNTNRIFIPKDLFETVDSILTIESVITNSMKNSASSSYVTELLGAREMNLKIDKGTELEISSSQNLELNVKLIDSCGVEESATYVWTITSSTSTQFVEGQVLNTDGKRKLRLKENYLTPGNVFELTVTATAESVSGSASIIITTLLDSLVPILNKNNGNISPLLDLVIDGSYSYDPNNMGYTIEYQWSCIDPTIGTTCVGSDGFALVSQETSVTLNIPATRLVGGSNLDIYFKIKTSEDSRESETVVSFYVYEGLSTNIAMIFNQEKVEASYFLYLEAKIVSNTFYTLKWTQVQGSTIQLETDYTPSMLFWPYTFIAGETYEFVLVATEVETGAFATASVKFSVNQPAACFSNLAVSPDIGVALVDIFTLSIDSCADLDETDVPLTYTFYLFPTDFAWIGISKPQSFNSISFRTFEGEFYALVRVCDTLGGCNWYFIENILTVTEYTGRRSLSDEDPIAFYESLVADNEEATVMYAISIVKTFTLTSDQVDYIYNDALSYIKSETIDVDSIDMMMKFIIKIIESQSSILNYNKIDEYTQIVMELIYNCTEDITSGINDLAQDLAITIIEFGLYDIKYITLANEFLDSITTVYASNMLPGNTIINSATSNFVYFKFREVTGNYENKNFTLENNIAVTIESLPFESTDLIDISIKSFPDEGGYSNILDITFTKYGVFENNVLEILEEEEVMKLTTSTVLFEIPALKNTTAGWGCQYYDGSSWKSDGCEFVEENDEVVKMRISHTSMFRLYDSSKIPSDDSNSSRTYAPVILISFLTMILLIAYTILSFVDRKIIKAEKKSKIQVISNKDPNFDDSIEKIDKYSNIKVVESPTPTLKKSILMHHLLLGIFTNDLDFIKADRVLTACLILATQFTIQGALIGFDAINLPWVSNMISFAAISVGLTIPLHVIANLKIRRGFRKGCSAMVVLGFIAFAANVALTLAMAVELTARHNTWIITFFWGLLFETLLEVIIMVGRHAISSS